MKPLLRILRIAAFHLARLTHPRPSILAPGIAVMLVWVALQPLDPGFTLRFVLSFCAGFLTLVLRRVWAQHRQGHPLFRRRAAALKISAVPLGIALLLIWVGDVVWCQRLISLQLMLLAVVHLLQLRAPDDADASWLWGRLDAPGLHKTLSGATVLLLLSALLANETLIRFVAPADWLLIWAVSPVVLHYAQVLVIEVAVLSDPPGDHET